MGNGLSISFSLLLQIPTTSPIKGYHSVLKRRKGKTNPQQSSLQGIAKLTDVIDQERHKRAKIAAARFRCTVLPNLSNFPRLKVLPVPVQSIIADEIRCFKKATRSSQGVSQRDKMQLWIFLEISAAMPSYLFSSLSFWHLNGSRF